MTLRSLVVVPLLFLVTSVGYGELIGNAFTLEAVNEIGTGVLTVSLDEGAFDDNGNYFWRFGGDDPNPQPIEITTAEGDAVATLEGAQLVVIADPVINLSFVVSSPGSATAFTITSPLLGFPTLLGADARASAQIGVTDIGGDGASLTGGLAGGTKSFKADYNGGTLFANLVSNASTGTAFDSITSSEDSPVAGFTSIGDVSSMLTSFSFTIGSFDSASGTSVFVTVPEPATFGMFGLAVMLAGLGFRRRR